MSYEEPAKGRKTGIRKKLGWPKRRIVYATTMGRCFYCGLPLVPDVGLSEDVHGHDWILPQHQQLMSVDHKLPVQRGGTDSIDNLVPACGTCNNRKGLSSVEEFRFRVGLKRGAMPHVFACEESGADRDFIVVCSPEFERPLIHHNFPDAYGHRQYTTGWGKR